jgi:4-aminobutyrate aminotransferase/(S)-3-amino-2-methylpropionate transaminase
MLSIFATDDLVGQGRRNAQTVAARLAQWENDYDIVGQGRSAGLSCGIELVEPGTDTPASKLAGQAKGLAAARGLLTMPAAGADGNVLRFGPALNIPQDLLSEGLDRLEAVLDHLQNTAA